MKTNRTAVSRLPVCLALAVWFLGSFAAALVAQQPRSRSIRASDMSQAQLPDNAAPNTYGPPNTYGTPNTYGYAEQHGDYPEADSGEHPFGAAFDEPQPAPDGRYTGRGEPLKVGSWPNRPLSAGAFIGNLWGQELVPGQFDQGAGLFGGFRTGWDFDYYWGGEFRIGFAQTAVTDELNGDEWNDHIWLADFNLLYYPWGDSRWRPYFTWGMGGAGFNFHQNDGLGFNDVVFSMPWGVGVKYRLRDWLVARFDLMDNVAFAGAGLETMHNYSLSGGLEYRFGGNTPSYWPWR
jgi:hypothetical protein